MSFFTIVQIQAASPEILAVYGGSYRALLDDATPTDISSNFLPTSLSPIMNLPASFSMDISGSAGQFSTSSPHAASPSSFLSSSLAKSMPLPCYSSDIKEHLLNGTIIQNNFERFIEETAHHIMKHGDMTKKEEYADFGSRLLRQYPFLNFPGRRTNFVSKLVFFFLIQHPHRS